jgi:two-component system, LytTR family, sensor kinase
LKIERSLTSDENGHKDPVFMHPAIFIGAFTCIGFFFALQDWIFMRRWAYQSSSQLPASVTFLSYTVFYFLWGALGWLMWVFLRPSIQNANVLRILTQYMPFSVAICFLQEIAWVYLFPRMPVNRAPMSYWPRLELNLEGDIANSMVTFWSAFFLFRGIGYYQQFREKEKAAAQLEVQLVNAKMAALRMQLNPHFLFNTMNSISSLMRFDIDAADTMLEQLSSLLRITLERGDVQLIPLRDEIEFIEVYLAMQGRRFAGRVRQSITVDPELHDALVPAMFLQPIVENAFAHGLSKVETDGVLAIDVQRDGKQMQITVLNSGQGLSAPRPRSDGRGVGLTNVRSRLKLHYNEGWSLSLVEDDARHVRATIRIPIQMAERQAEPMARYGA